MFQSCQAIDMIVS